MTKQFLVISQHKTGSRMLCDMLASHPDLKCPHEYLDRPSHNADWRQALADLGPGGVGHVQAKSVTDDMLTADVQRIVLTRDPIDSALSFLRITFEPSEGQWEIPPDAFHAEVSRRTTAADRLLASADYVIRYEDLTQGGEMRECPASIAANLCRFLGVELAPLRTRIRKNKPAHPSNWKELINGSPYRYAAA